MQLCYVLLMHVAATPRLSQPSATAMTTTAPHCAPSKHTCMPLLLDVRVNLHALLADRQAVGKITGEGVFLEALERSPVKYLPEVTDDKLSATVVKVGGALCISRTQVRSKFAHA